MITLTLFGTLAVAEELPDPPASAPDDQANAAPPQDKNSSVLDVNPGSQVLKNRDFYDQTGVFHPFVRMPRYVLLDQKAIWTSPFHTSKKNIKWWVLMGAATGALIAADKSIDRQLPQANSTLVSVSNGASSIGSGYSLIPISAGFYFIGAGTHDEKVRETGLLAFETLIDTEIAVEVLKIVADRSRPYQNNGTGRFEDNPSGRWSSGFPSGHAISTWALASIVAHEYPHSKIIPLAAYGLALTVSVARVGARQHFSSDVVAGSAMGWFIGDFVYGKRHNDELTGKKTVAQMVFDHIHIGMM
ncbi:MAG TPA: phosphatase PAP2 family protein [Bryobacteraceae bacterium]|nr:phosphatase PAP2 family protein [Bryobacteraceae bacterium]